MKPEDRYRFIEKWLKDRSKHIPASVDCLDQAFVDEYIEVTGAKFGAMMIGAHRCNQLARDLSTMAKLGRLERWRSGLQGLPMGFPRWVWCYALPRRN